MPKGGRKAKTEAQFILDCRKVHEDKYDYSLVSYTRGRDKVTIVCPVHGPFSLEAQSHCAGHGCRECNKLTKKKTGPAVGMYRKTKELFVEEASKVHGSFYDYSNFVYTHGKEPSTILCPIHGPFLQIPNSHLQGSGCRKCGLVRAGMLGRGSTETFIARAKVVHNDYYDYTKSTYTKSGSLLKIICPVHGDFELPATSHLSGQGCKKCSITKRSKELLIPEEDFLKRCTEIHNGKYDYSKAIYTGTKYKFIVTCPMHGDFMQNAGHHSKGIGCPACRKLKSSYNYFNRCSDPLFADREGCLYLLKISKDSEIFGKIGVTVDFENRLRGYKHEGLQVVELDRFPMTALESAIMEDVLLDYLRVNRKTYTPSFTFGGCTECFKLEDYYELLEVFHVNHHMNCSEEGTDCVFELDIDDDFCYNTYSIEQEMEDERLAPINPWGKSPC